MKIFSCIPQDHKKITCSATSTYSTISTCLVHSICYNKYSVTFLLLTKATEILAWAQVKLCCLRALHYSSSLHFTLPGLITSTPSCISFFNVSIWGCHGNHLCFILPSHWRPRLTDLKKKKNPTIYLSFLSSHFPANILSWAVPSSLIHIDFMT